MIFQTQIQIQNQCAKTHANQANHATKSSGSGMLDSANDGVH